MVIGFTKSTYAISANHHWYLEFESRSGRGVQHYVIKFVSDLQTGGWFSLVSSTNKTGILLKVALNTKNPPSNINPCKIFWLCAVVYLHFFTHLRYIRVLPFIKLQVEHTLGKMATKGEYLAIDKKTKQKKPIQFKGYQWNIWLTIAMVRSTLENSPLVQLWTYRMSFINWPPFFSQASVRKWRYPVLCVFLVPKSVNFSFKIHLIVKC